MYEDGDGDGRMEKSSLFAKGLSWPTGVLAYDGGTHAFSLAAQKLGLASPFRIPASQWPQLVESLVALRRNVSGFYTLPEESLDLYRRRGGWLMLANYGRQQFQLLRQAGLDVRYALPREGALAWLDCWAISRHALSRSLFASRSALSASSCSMRLYSTTS